MNCEKQAKDKCGLRQCKNKHYQDGLCKVHHRDRFGPYKATIVDHNPPFSKGLAIILITVVLFSIAAVGLSIICSTGAYADLSCNPIGDWCEDSE